jgi:hypothetical protein
MQYNIYSGHESHRRRERTTRVYEIRGHGEMGGGI